VNSAYIAIGAALIAVGAATLARGRKADPATAKGARTPGVIMLLAGVIFIAIGAIARSTAG
jgi:hypothetical protein